MITSDSGARLPRLRFEGYRFSGGPGMVVTISEWVLMMVRNETQVGNYPASFQSPV